jgi:4-amino-4-deoxychorismate lyase
MSVWFVNGEEIDAIPADDRGLQYGDGLFETVAIRNGQPRFWELHMERLHTGCARLRIPPPAERSLYLEMQSAIAASDFDTNSGLAKIIVSTGSGPRGYQRPDELRPVIRIGLFESVLPAGDDYREGVAVLLCQTRLANQPQLAGIKSLNRLEQVLARTEWSKPAIAEGLMLDTDDRLICGTMSNVFIRVAGNIATPALTRCGVSGVMRRHIIAMLARQGVDCDVRDIPLGELYAADEVFLTNSQFGVLPVRQVAAREFAVGATTRHVMQLAAGSGVNECSL